MIMNINIPTVIIANLILRNEEGDSKFLKFTAISLERESCEMLLGCLKFHPLMKITKKGRKFFEISFFRPHKFEFEEVFEFIRII